MLPLSYLRLVLLIQATIWNEERNRLLEDLHVAVVVVIEPQIILLLHFYTLPALLEFLCNLFLEGGGLVDEADLLLDADWL